MKRYSSRYALPGINRNHFQEMMDLPDNFFENPEDGSFRRGKEHAVIIDFYYGTEELDPLHELDLALADRIEEEGVGVYDGHEINMDGTDGRLFMYGPNADLLFKAALPVLTPAYFMEGAVATLQFRSHEERVNQIDIEIPVRNN